ncbi:MAG: hypothetical protein ACRDRL_22830 [Sciscionella sp.]
MRLEQGPIPTITSDWLDANPIQPDFTSEFTAIDFELSLLEQQMDQWIDPSAVIDGVLENDGIFDAIDQAAADTAGAAAFADLGQTDPMDSMWTDATAGIINAYDSIPAEAFQPVPDALDYGGTAPPPAVPGNAQVGLYNITRRGATDFIAGENYQVNININPAGQVLNQYYKVTVTWWPESDTGSLGQSTLGVTDLNGQASFYGTWPIDSAGNWDAVVEGTDQAGNTGVLAHLYWTISAPGQSSTPEVAHVATAAVPIAVKFEAPPYGANPPLMPVGTGWRLTVTGPPFAPVVIGGGHSGSQLTPVQLGATDATGTFILNGITSHSDIGVWTETYTVGGVLWNGALNFQVQ